MAAVDAEHLPEVAPTEDEDAVEAVGANRAHPTLGEGVRVRRLHRGADDSDASGSEDLVKGVAELRVAVVDQEPEPVLLAELHDQVAGLLANPCTVRVGRAREVLDPPGC